MQRHAYLILVHNEPEVLDTLLDTIDDPRNDIFLHVDAKSVGLLQRFEQKRLKHSRLSLVAAPIKVYWGHTSQVEAELKCLQAALAQGPYSRYHLLSGVDMPIKTQDEIHRFFDAHADAEFIGYWPSETHEADAVKKVRYHYLFNRYKHSKRAPQHYILMPLRNLLLMLQKTLGVKRPLARQQIKKGFNWFSISEGLCRFVVGETERIRHDFRHTLCPDEIFLQTLVWHSPFRPHIFDPNDAQRGSMRAIDWERGNPYTWSPDEAASLVKESPYLFARKCSLDTARAISRLLSPE